MCAIRTSPRLRDADPLHSLTYRHQGRRRYKWRERAVARAADRRSATADQGEPQDDDPTFDVNIDPGEIAAGDRHRIDRRQNRSIRGEPRDTPPGRHGP